MGNSQPLFFDNLDIFATQYVVVYDQLKQQHPWWSVETLMKVAKETTIEYLHLKLKDELKAKPLWPREFKP